MFHPCPGCGETAPSIATTVWLDILDAHSSETAHMEIHDIQTDEVTLHCERCGGAIPLCEQATADMLVTLFAKLFQVHGLDPSRVGALILTDPSPSTDTGPVTA